MLLLPEWFVYVAFAFPVLVLAFISIVYLVCLAQSVFFLKKTGLYINHFSEVTQIYNTQATVAFCISVSCTLAGLGAGVPSTHWVIGMWGFIMAYTSILYTVFVLDYWNLKRKGII